MDLVFTTYYRPTPCVIIDKYWFILYRQLHDNKIVLIEKNSFDDLVALERL